MNAHKPFFAGRRVSIVRSVFALALAAMALSGCARRYDMMLTNGGVLTNVRKPTRIQSAGIYTFVDGKGLTNVVAISRVVEIHPHQRVDFKAPDTH